MRVYIYIFGFLFIVGLFFLIRFLVSKEIQFRKNMTEGMSEYNKLQFLSGRNKKTLLTVVLIAVPLALVLVIGFGLVVNIGIR